jgi:hypothetical protein
MSEVAAIVNSPGRAGVSREMRGVSFSPLFLPFTAAFYARARARAHNLRYRARASAQVEQRVFL